MLLQSVPFPSPRYGRDYQDAMVKNYAMIMKLIKHVAESDQLRHLLNDLVTSVNDRTLANYILEELMMYPGLVSTGFDIFQHLHKYFYFFAIYL